MKYTKVLSSTIYQIPLDACKYKISFKFYCIDVTTQEELIVDNVLINDMEPKEMHIEEIDNGEGETRYQYFVNDEKPVELKLTVEKTKYYPATRKFKIEPTSIYADPVVFDLGLIPMLKEIKTNALVLTWNKYPSDLDVYVTNPDGSQTSTWDRKTYYSMVDVDDKTGFGPETISINRWADINSKYKIGGTFNYRVKWWRSGQTTSKTNAVVYAFIDAENPIQFNIRPSLETHDRQGEDWEVFDIDLQSIIGKYEVNKENLITVDVNQISKTNFGNNTGEILINRNDYLKLIFDNFNFIYEVYDNGGKEIPPSAYTIIKNYDSLRYVFTGAAADGMNTIKFFINEDFKKEDLPYTTINGKSFISYEEFFNEKIIPFVLYNDDGKKFENINYRFSNEYGRNELYINILEKKYNINQVSKISFILGVNDTHDYSEFKDLSGNVVSGISTYDSFLYQDAEEIKDVKFKFNDETEKLNIIGNIYYTEKNHNYHFNCVDKFDINLLPYTNNTHWVNFDANEYQLLYETHIVENVKLTSAGKIVSINFIKMEIKDTAGEKIDINYALKKIILKNQDETTRELNFTYEFDVTKLIIYLEEEVENVICDFEFQTIYTYIPREKFNIPKEKNNRPNIYIYKNNEEIQEPYYYVWDASGVGIYFINDPDLINQEYKIKLIDFFKIYQINVHELNYYDKKLNVNLEIENYDKNYMFSSDIIPDDPNWSEYPLYWINYNLYKFKEKYNDYILEGSYCNSSKLGYPNSNNPDYFNNKNVMLDAEFDGIQGNDTEFVLGLNSTYLYKANILTKIKKNNFISGITLYDDNDIDSNLRQTHIDDTKDQTLTYKVQWPYVNFFGNFYDESNNCYSNEAIKNQVFTERSSDNVFFPKIAYEVLLENTDPSLSNDLKYNFIAPYKDKHYSYTYIVNSNQNLNLELKYYNFIFKHSAFSKNENDWYYGYDAYNQYIESIIPGNYSSKIRLYNIDFNATKNTGTFDLPIYESNYEEYNTEVLKLTKNEESTLKFYNYKYKIPLITISGSIINSSNNSLVYGQGLTVELINKENSNISRKFVYDCFFGGYQHIIDWSKENHKYFNQSFLFKLFGLCRKPNLNLSAGEGIPSYFTYSDNADSKYHECGVPRGTYNLKVYYNNEYSNENIIFHEDNNFIVSNNNNLMNLKFESPLIDFTGKLVDSNGKILSGENWNIYIKEAGKSEISRQYRYKYSLNEKRINERINETNFKFENLPLSSYFDTNNSYNENEEFIKERQLRYALQEKTYEVQIKYKNKLVSSFIQSFTKENERLGKYNDVSLNLGEVLKDLKLVFINGQYNLEIEPVNASESEWYNKYRVSYLTLHDENFDGDLTDDEFNGTKINGPDDLKRPFKDLFIGYYKLDSEFIDLTDKETLSALVDIVDRDTIPSASGNIIPYLSSAKSIYEKKSQTGAKYDLINLGSENASSNKTYAVVFNHWWANFNIFIENIVIKSDLIESRIVNLNENTSRIEKGQEIGLTKIKTGPYKITSKIKFSDGSSIDLFEPKYFDLTKSGYIELKSEIPIKNVRFEFFGKVNDGTHNVTRIPNEINFTPLYFSLSKDGEEMEYYSDYLGGGFYGHSKIFNDLMNGLYYRIENIGTDYHYEYNWGYPIGKANILGIYKKKYKDEDIISGKISLSEITGSENIMLSNGKFKVDELDEYSYNDSNKQSAYYLILDKYVVRIDLIIRDSNKKSSSLNYSFYLYDINNKLVAKNTKNAGGWSIENIWSGKYRIEIYYQGINVTPSKFKNVYQTWTTNHTVYEEPIYIDLDFPLISLSNTIVYPGKNGELLDLNCNLRANFYKLTSNDGGLLENKIQYYFYGGGGNSSIDGTYLIRNKNGLKLNELMPGIYQIDIFYNKFNYSELAAYVDKRYRGELTYIISNSKPTFPIKIKKSDIFEKYPHSKLFIENFDLCLIEEDYHWSEWINGESKYYSNHTIVENGYTFDQTSDSEYFIIDKKPGTTPLFEEIPSNVELSNYFAISFGDRLKRLYLMINESGGKFIDKSEISNYQSIKNQETSTNLGNIILPYTYIHQYEIEASGYIWEQHYNKHTTLEMVETESNHQIFNRLSFGGGWSIYPAGIGYYSYFIIKSNKNYKFIYRRSDYVLGQATYNIDRENQHMVVLADKLGSIEGTIINSSINEPIKSKIYYSIYLESDEGNQNFTNDTTLYYDGSIDKSLSGSFNFKGLFINDRAKINLWITNKLKYDPIIKLISGDIKEDFYIPYELFNFEVIYKSNKPNEDIGDEPIYADIEPGVLILTRQTNDGYDENYIITKNQEIKTGFYSSIIFEDNTKNVRYEYNDILIKNNVKFVFRFDCQFVNVTINLASVNHILKIFDECGNLYSIKTPSSNAVVGPIALRNVKYEFKSYDKNENMLKTTGLIKLDEENTIINLN